MIGTKSGSQEGQRGREGGRERARERDEVTRRQRQPGRKDTLGTCEGDAVNSYKLMTADHVLRE
jgi:hypothetical protein